MRSSEKIKRLFAESRVTVSSEVNDRMVKDSLLAYRETDRSRSIATHPGIWRAITRSRITKVAAAATIVVFAVGLLMWLSTGKSVSSIAFADVLETVRTSSYTFDMTVLIKMDASSALQPSGTLQAMVLGPGRMRVDGSTGVGEISSIVDVTKGKSLILFHRQKAGIRKIPKTGTYAEAGGLLSLCTKPVENLWNMQDGTEKLLGEKEIDGLPATGFKVLQKDKDFQYEITIWANTKTKAPISVEMIQASLDDPAESIGFMMTNFALKAQLGENLFSVEIPAGYTLAYESHLDELELGTERSIEAEKIEELLRLGSQDKKSEALEILLGIDWTKKFTFSEKPYVFTITGKQYVSLKPEDQRKVMDEVSAVQHAVRVIVKEATNLGQAAVSVKDYKKAERYFDAALQLGKLLTADPDRMLGARLAGIAAEQRALKEMIKLYTLTSDPEKLRAAENELQKMQNEFERIRKSVSIP